MKKIRLFFALMLLQAGVTAVAGTPGEVLVGSPLREARLGGLLHGARQFSDYRGKPLLINVWASWCGPCREEMGSLERLARRFDRSFNVIGISTDDDRAAALAFLKSAKTTFPNYIDSNLILENMLGANRIPLTVLVDAEGRVVSKVAGSRVWDSPESVEMIAKALKIKM